MIFRSGRFDIIPESVSVEADPKEIPVLPSTLPLQGLTKEREREQGKFNYHFCQSHHLILLTPIFE